MKPRILFIAGINSKKTHLDGWRKNLRELKVDFLIVGDINYSPTDINTICDIMHACNNFANQGPTIVIGHSFGGLIGKKLVHDNPNIIKLYQLATPHKEVYLSFLLSQLGDIRNVRNVPIITYGGGRDSIVSDFSAKSSESKKHITFPEAKHESFLKDFEIRRKIIEEVLELEVDL